MKNTILILSLVLSTNFCFSQDYSVYFDFDRAILRLNDIGKLDQLIKSFDRTSERISLIGHTDTLGNVKYNLDLSKRRAESIKEYLVLRGIPSQKIDYSYRGKSTPSSNDQIFNRRVEIFITSESDQYSSFEEFNKSLEPVTQEFEIPADQDVEIECGKGTIIQIPANSFVDSKGNEIRGNITFMVDEFYSMREFYSKKLSTVSNGNLLTSAGMVDLSAYQDNAELSLKSSSDLTILFPKSNDQRYFTFYGERDESGNMNWVSDNRQVSRGNQTPEIGATISDDGQIVIVDKQTAEKRNSNLRFNPVTGKFGDSFSEEELEQVKEYYEEQERMDKKREEFYNTIQANRLGFINCDEFVRDPSSVAVAYNIRLLNADVKLVSATLIFRKTNSLMEFTSKTSSQAALYARLPLNEDVELLVTGTKDDKPYFYHSKVKLEEEKVDDITLELTDFESLKKKI